MIDRATKNLVLRTAVKEHGWKPGDVRIGAVEKLERNGCSFYRATNTAQVGRPPSEYALLPNGEIVGANGAEKVLRACGKDAPAEWWAQVVTRLSGKVRGLVVAPRSAPTAVRKMRAAGKEWTPPKMVAAAGTTSLVFYTMHYEEGVPYEVKVALPAKGALSVTSKVVQ